MTNTVNRLDLPVLDLPPLAPTLEGPIHRKQYFNYYLEQGKMPLLTDQVIYSFTFLSPRLSTSVLQQPAAARPRDMDISGVAFALQIIIMTVLTFNILPE